ncbi:MAG: hypothetical protein ACON5F_10240 [Jejuia sp.]
MDHPEIVRILEISEDPQSVICITNEDKPGITELTIWKKAFTMAIPFEHSNEDLKPF